MNIITELSQRKRLIIIGDIHGDISVLCSCLYMTKVINNNMEWIAEPQDTVVIQMGDQVDGLSRNDNDTENWEQIEDTKILTFTERLDSIAKEKGGRFISLLGNHELMNVFGDFSYVSNNSMIKTGGELNRKYLFKPGSKYSKILATRPIILKIGKLLFCHAGLLMKHLKLVNNNLETINILSNKYLFSLDYSSQAWKKYLINNVSSFVLRDAYKISCGFEYRPVRELGSTFWEQIIFRTGLSYEQTQYLIYSKGINQYSVSLGASLPLSNENTLDFSLMYSRRGTKELNLLQEDIIKLGIGFSLGELWFLRQDK